MSSGTVTNGGRRKLNAECSDIAVYDAIGNRTDIVISGNAVNTQGKQLHSGFIEREVPWVHPADLKKEEEGNGKSK